MPYLMLSVHFVRAMTRELPNNFPFIVKKRLISTVVEGWDSPSKKLFNFTKNELHKRVKDVIEVHFSQYTHGHLKQRVTYVFLSFRLTLLIDMFQEHNAWPHSEMCRCRRATHELSA